jgi:hypothetical protein
VDGFFVQTHIAADLLRNLLQMVEHVDGTVELEVDTWEGSGHAYGRSIVSR